MFYECFCSLEDSTMRVMVDDRKDTIKYFIGIYVSALRYLNGAEKMGIVVLDAKLPASY